MQNETKMSHANRRAILGVFLVVLGGFFLARNFDLLPDLPRWLFSWEMILIYIGVISFFTGNRGAAVVLIGLGGLFLLKDYYYLDFRDWWPLILIIIGLAFIFRQRQITKGNVLSDNYFDSVNIFGGGNQKVVSHKLEGGKVTAIFGGAEIDLRESKPVDGATIEIFSMFGGAELIVPKEWNIRNEMTSILGGFADERTVQVNEDGPTVTIRGTVILGGGDIKS